MKKLKIYLDTSVISHLDAPDVPDKMADTLKLWEYIKAGVYDVVISDVVTDELAKCAEPKRSKLAFYLS
jgi:predicted nucleic acid-binding protein